MSDPSKRFGILLRSRVRLFWLQTREEKRMTRELRQVALKAGWGVARWDTSAAAIDLSGADPTPLRGFPEAPRGCAPQALVAALDAVVRADRQARQDQRAQPSAPLPEPDRQLWVVLDSQPLLGLPVRRGLVNACAALQNTAIGFEHAVVVLSPDACPPELRDHATPIDWPLPTREQHERAVRQTVDAQVEGLEAAAALSEASGDADRAARARKALALLTESARNGAFEAAVDACCGLTELQAADAISACLADKRTLDPASIREEKRSIINGVPGLTWYDPDPRGLDAVGGNALLTAWLVGQGKLSTPAAREAGIAPPKGVVLTGQPGTGKTLTAKALATAWGVPLVRFDLAGLFSKYVGDTEANVQRVLSVLDSVGRVVVLIDEGEKAFEGGSGDSGDGGVARRAMGSILSWLNDREGGAYILFTANDVTRLPAELLRKGRFDEVWFVDLPNGTERKDIAAVGLRGINRNPDAFDLAAIATASAEYSGAEIIGCVEAALKSAFIADEELVTSHIVAELTATSPGSKLAEETYIERREWAKGRARFASAPESTAGAAAGSRTIEF